MTSKYRFIVLLGFAQKVLFPSLRSRRLIVAQRFIAGKIGFPRRVRETDGWKNRYITHNAFAVPLPSEQIEQLDRRSEYNGPPWRGSSVKVFEVKFIAQIIYSESE
jgi:hypothetical protein